MIDLKISLSDVLSSGKGVYGIVNRKNNRTYIGSTTTSFRRRIFQHINNLRKNKHENKHLQNAWNKYGESAFFVMILLETDKDKEYILAAEQYYLDKYKNKYNISKIANIPSGYKHTLQSREQMSKRRKGKNIKHLQSISGNRKGKTNNAARSTGKAMRKYYGKLIDSTGKIYDVFGLREFCELHNLQRAHVLGLFSGKAKTHKNWRLYELAK